jgi:hypothetical protein
LGNRIDWRSAILEVCQLAKLAYFFSAICSEPLELRAEDLAGQAERS